MAGKKVVVVVAVVGLALASVGAWWLQQQGAVKWPWAAVAAVSPDPAGGGRPASGAPGAADVPGGARPGGGAGKGGDGAGGPGAGGGGGRGPGGGGPGGPAGVEVAKVGTARLVDDSQSVGTLRARQSVILRPEVSGRIKALNFTDGQKVRKGELLVQLDDTLQQAQLKQAEASASIARTNLERSRELAAQNFVSKSAVDQNVAALDVALAQVALAQAQIGRMRIHAPFDGITGIRVANVGDYVKDGADLVTVEDLSSLLIDFRLPERYLTRLKEGQEVDLMLDAVPGKTYGARIVALDAQVDTNGRALLVRARLSNVDGRLRGGMFARARTVFSSRDNAVVAPEEALVPVGEQQIVFKIVDGEGGAKVAQRQPVRIGTRLPGQVEIVEGLAEGDTVVVAGQTRLMRGNNLPVRIVELGKRGGPGAGAGASGGGDASAGGGAGGAPGKGAAPSAGSGPAPAGAPPAAAAGASGAGGAGAGSKGDGAGRPAGGKAPAEGGRS